MALQVRLSVDRGLVARFLQQFGEGLLIPVEGVPIIHEAILVAVLAGLDYRPTGSANRIGAKAIDE